MHRSSDPPHILRDSCRCLTSMRSGCFASYRAGRNTIDGTQYHSSTSIHCDCCLSKTHRNGEITYSHTVLQGAIMHPDKKQVIPLMPEAIKNGDGSKKQDCEINAAKRFVQKLKSTHPRQGYLVSDRKIRFSLSSAKFILRAARFRWPFWEGSATAPTYPVMSGLCPIF